MITGDVPIPENVMAELSRPRPDDFEKLAVYADDGDLVVEPRPEIRVKVLEGGALCITVRQLGPVGARRDMVTIPAEDIRAVARRMLELSPGRRGVALRGEEGQGTLLDGAS